jgi:hypothetical protein
VEAIANIAHQTNRLALDAAIQAAMAGENGKGFGAVAADIRRLAERAKELSTEIGHIVRSVRDDIAAVAISMNDTERETFSGSRLAAEAGTSLESIVTVIERQANEIEGINQMAGQQQQSSTEVVRMMQNVSESTEHNTDSTREAAQNMKRIARLAEELLASVETFKLRDSLDYAEMPNASYSEGFSEARTPGEIFRTVSPVSQPLGASGVPPIPTLAGRDGYFPQFPQFIARPYTQENTQNNGEYLQQPFPGGSNKQTPLPAPGNASPTYQGQGGNYATSTQFSPTGGLQHGLPSWNNSQHSQPLPAPGDWPGAPQFQNPGEEGQPGARKQSYW